MILSIFRIGAMGMLLCGMAAPASADDHSTSTSAKAADSVERSARARRVELPFLLDLRPPAASSREEVRRWKSAPHPFRAIELEQPLRASAEVGKSPRVRLSPTVAVG